jgi:hypothetical protein
MGDGTAGTPERPSPGAAAALAAVAGAAARLGPDFGPGLAARLAGRTFTPPPLPSVKPKPGSGPLDLAAELREFRARNLVGPPAPTAPQDAPPNPQAGAAGGAAQPHPSPPPAPPPAPPAVAVPGPPRLGAPAGPWAALAASSDPAVRGYAALRAAGVPHDEAMARAAPPPPAPPTATAAQPHPPVPAPAAVPGPPSLSSAGTAPAPVPVPAGPVATPAAPVLPASTPPAPPDAGAAPQLPAPPPPAGDTLAVPGPPSLGRAGKKPREFRPEFLRVRPRRPPRPVSPPTPRKPPRLLRLPRPSKPPTPPAPPPPAPRIDRLTFALRALTSGAGLGNMAGHLRHPAAAALLGTGLYHSRLARAGLAAAGGLRLASAAGRKGLKRGVFSAARHLGAGKSFAGRLAGAAGAAGTLGGVGFAAAAFTKAVVGMTEAALQSQRHLAEMSGSMAAVFAVRDVREALRDLRHGERTAPAAAKLVSAEQNLKDALEPIESLLENVKAVLLSEVAQTLADLLQPVKYLAEVANRAFGGDPERNPYAEDLKRIVAAFDARAAGGAPGTDRPRVARHRP